MSENFNTQVDAKTEEKNFLLSAGDSKKTNVNGLNLPANEWFILRNNNHVGPFTQKKLLELFYQESINEYSLLWKEGFEDWTPLKKIPALYKIVQPEAVNQHSLPDLPDLRLIEMEAQRELAQRIPPPQIRKKYVLDSTKRNKVIEELEAGVEKVNQETKYTSNSANQMYTSNFDDEAKIFTAAKILDTSGIRISLPPIPLESDLEEFFHEEESEVETKIPIVPGEEMSKALFREATPEILESRESRKWIYNLMAVAVFAMFVTIPIFYVVISNRPVLHSVDGMSKEGMQRINLATSELFNQSEILFNMALTKNKELFAGINRSGQFNVKGLLTPVEKKVAGPDLKPIVVSGESVGGLVKFNLNGSNRDSIVPGLYKVNLNLVDTSNMGKFYQLIKNLPGFSEINFIKNYQRNFSLNQEAWLGPHSIFLTKRFVEDYQREVWENISRPFDGLFQHFDTLISLIDRFNEIYFNATTAKEFAQSKIIFARKYGREVAPILQMIASEELTDEAIKELKLPENLIATYRDGHVLAQSIARSVSAVAGDIDLYLSIKKSWNQFVRIEQRNKVAKNLVSLSKQIQEAREELEKSVKSNKKN